MVELHREVTIGSNPRRALPAREPRRPAQRVAALRRGLRRLPGVYPIQFWSAECLNWSIVTRAHAPRQVDCVGYWSKWSTCSLRCDGGTTTRVYTVTTRDLASPAGIHWPCPNDSPFTLPCNTQTCCHEGGCAWPCRCGDDLGKQTLSQPPVAARSDFVAVFTRFGTRNEEGTRLAGKEECSLCKEPLPNAALGHPMNQQRFHQGRNLLRCEPLELDARALSDCHFAVQLEPFVPGFLSYSSRCFSKVTIGYNPRYEPLELDEAKVKPDNPVPPYVKPLPPPPPLLPAYRDLGRGMCKGPRYRHQNLEHRVKSGLKDEARPAGGHPLSSEPAHSTALSTQPF